MKKITIAILFLIVFFIVYPASAYTEYWSKTWNSISGGSIEINGVQAKNLSVFCDITHMTLKGGLYCEYANSGTYSNTFTVGGVTKGNYTATWSCSMVQNYNGYAELTLDIDDCNMGASTGAGYIAFTGLSNWASTHYFATTKDNYNYATESNQHTAYPGNNANTAGPTNTTTKTYYGSSIITPVSAFTCSPSTQQTGQDVVCTDESTNTPTSWYWMAGINNLSESLFSDTGRNFTWTSMYPMLYDVRLQATNAAGSDWENKSSYVRFQDENITLDCDSAIATGYVRTYVQNVDGSTSGAIHYSDISIKDVESAVWSNVTNHADGTHCIDTLPSHTINAYGAATGYNPTSRLSLPSFSQGVYELIMWSTSIQPPSAGNVTLYVIVDDKSTASPIYNANVLVESPNGNSIMKNTGPEGQAMFTVKNASLMHITAKATGYITATRTLTTSNSGPDTIRIELSKQTITVAPTVTPSITGGPTPGPTIDTRTTSQKDLDMMDQIRNYGPDLINLAILATIFGLVGLIGKSMK